MIIALIPPVILIVGGSVLMTIRVKRALELALWCSYVATFLYAIYWVYGASLPHVIRKSSGRLSPTVGMIIGEVNALVAISGMLTIIVIFFVSRNMVQTKIRYAVLIVISIFLVSLLFITSAIGIITAIAMK